MVLVECDGMSSVSDSEKGTLAQYTKYTWIKNDTEKFFSELYDLIVNHLHKEILS